MAHSYRVVNLSSPRHKKPRLHQEAGFLSEELQVAAPCPRKDVVRLRVGLSVAFTAPEEALFAVERLFLLAAPHFLPLPFWDRALAAAVFEAALVRPSLRTLLAAEAALELVCFEFFEAMVLLLPQAALRNTPGPTRRTRLNPFTQSL